jgi:hypothetical protein
VITAKGFDTRDGILHRSIRDQIGDIAKRLHRRGEVEKIGHGRASRWKLASLAATGALAVGTLSCSDRTL